MMEEVKKTGLTFTDTRRLANISYKDIKNGFVGFGYYLKIIKDEKLWQGNGYNSFSDFLDAEYGKDKSWASRCINLYDKFGIPVEPGELPRLEEQYEAYNVSQLIEMLPMDEGLREQVTPDMKIPDIRAMKPKRKKKVATVATPEPAPKEPIPPEPGQDSCPPGIMDCQRQEWGTEPAEQEAGQKECKACWASWKRKQKKQGAAEMQHEEMDAAEVQQDTLSAYGTPKSVYPEDSLIAMAGCEGGHCCTSCHVECGIRQDDCYCVEAPMGNPFPCDTLKSVHTLRNEIGSKCQFVDHDLAYHRAGDHEPVPCCKDCKSPCRYICSRAKKQLEAKANIPQEPNPSENVIDGEFTEIEEPEESLTELQIAKEELDRAKDLLEKGLRCVADENDIHIRRLKTKVCALASYVCDLELIESPPPEPKQPELPLLKNNDQRAAFIDNYESWPLWIETEQTGERYYRYDLDDGTSMVVKVYHAMIFDYKATSLKYEDRFTEGYGRQEYYLLQPGKFFRDCETNRSFLIEKLKEIQKPKKKGETLCQKK